MLLLPESQSQGHTVRGRGSVFFHPGCPVTDPTEIFHASRLPRGIFTNCSDENEVFFLQMFLIIIIICDHGCLDTNRSILTNKPHSRKHYILIT